MALPLSPTTFHPPSFRRPSTKRDPLLLPKWTNPSISLSPPSAAAATAVLQSPEDAVPTFEQPPTTRWNLEPAAEGGGSASAHWAHLVPAAVRLRDLRLARSLHAAVVKTRAEDHDSGTCSSNTIISLYVKLGRVADARKVFDEMPHPDVVSYTTLIASYAKSESKEKAIGLFFRMRRREVEPNEYTYTAILSACSSNFFRLGPGLHALTVKTNHFSDVFVSNAAMALYIKNGRLGNAMKLFDGMPERDTGSWNTIMSGMVGESRHWEALEFFHFMKMDGHGGDFMTLSTLLTAAQRAGLPAEGRCIHAYGIKKGLELELSVGNALISFYTHFGCLDDVVDVFQRMPTRDVVSGTGMLNAYMEFGQTERAMQFFMGMPERNSITYSSLLAGFCHNGNGERALNMFIKMVENGMEISDWTLTSAVNACALMSELERSRQVHAFVIKVGCESNKCVNAALLDMYLRCNRMDEGRRILDRWPHRKDYLIAWTSVVCRYLQNGQPDKALSLFGEVIKQEGLVSMDGVAISAILRLCGMLGFIGLGEQLHGHAIKSGDICHHVAIGNSLLSMYSECRNMCAALKVFHLMKVQDVISWNALLSAHLLNRQGDEALAVWKKMETEDICPDEISFLLIVSACKYTFSDSVSTCRKLFASMDGHHGIKPSEEHYASFVEVLCNWNCFSEAEELIKNMPVEPGAVVWKALMNGCRLRSNPSLGRQATQRILAVKPVDSKMYVLISNIYSSCGRWHCSEKVRDEMKEMGLHKRPAQSWILHKNKLHLFYTRDRSHLQHKDIYSALDILILESMKAGYVPNPSFVLHEVEEYQKEEFLFYHSAKLAVTYGILVADLGKPVSAMKNIHLCGDCHSFFKYVSLVTGREIVFRDTTGFHHFKNGQCSCRDYW